MTKKSGTMGKGKETQQQSVRERLFQGGYFEGIYFWLLLVKKAREYGRHIADNIIRWFHMYYKCLCIPCCQCHPYFSVRILLSEPLYEEPHTSSLFTGDHPGNTFRTHPNPPSLLRRQSLMSCAFTRSPKAARSPKYFSRASATWPGWGKGSPISRRINTLYFKMHDSSVIASVNLHSTYFGNLIDIFTLIRVRYNLP